MDTKDEFFGKPRADTVKMESGPGIHDYWALHKFALETKYDWMPTHLRCYHPGRMIDGELMEGYYDEFIPIAHDSPRGRVLKKKITEETLYCPDCEEPAKKIDTGEPVCPECGLICDDGRPTYEIVSDPKAAGRVDTQSGYYGSD
jgi:hypothetical protein